MKEMQMAACKFQKVTNPPPDLTIKKSDLTDPNNPVTCTLHNPPGGMSIVVAELFRPGSPGSPFDLQPSAQSFQIPPKSTNFPGGDPTGLWRLHVQVRGGVFPPGGVVVVEDCGGSQIILTIVDGGTKEAFVTLEVQQ
jgi:hypothetical protein